ncbi:MAG: hypothetical protein IH621_04295, partial [Krumholzibacteria bacterium]|nr:hypothetical protein [Candidatus Krumholzibacteria bacterium]
EVVAKAKALTTRHDLAVGISGAVDAVLGKAAVDPSAIKLVSMSTTLATNALVEGQGGRVALVMIGFSEADLSRDGLKAALGSDPVVFCPGGHDVHGNAQPLDLSPLETALPELEKGVSGFAVCAYFATRNPAHENAARELIRARTGLPVTASHELSAKLGGPRRALTTLLNARLIAMIDRLVAATEGFLEKRGISAPLMVVRGDGGLYTGADVDLLPGTVVDTRGGPVILDQGVGVGAHVFLEGPLYLGPGCRVKAGARLYGESSYGVGNRLAGEIGESTFGDFANKQHDGFIGHAVLGSWVNLGAMTTCSDLKNNYGPVRVDLGFGAVDTGLRFVGLLMGDHAKTAIGTLFNTGTAVGFGANVFGDGMPPKHVPCFSWGGRPDSPAYARDKAAATAAVVFGRRGCRFGPDHERLFASVASS